MDKEYYARFRDARLVSLIRVEVNEGDGTTADPIVRVVYYLNPATGKVLATAHEIKERKFAGQDISYTNEIPS